MTMNDSLIQISALIAGLLLGTVFFGGLWWSVRKGLSSKKPALWFLGSMLVRMSVVVVGFYYVGREHWERLIMCLFGFVVARVLVMRFTRTPVQQSDSQGKEASRAS
jgi:F1F0 ATPase subunit 2